MSRTPECYKVNPEQAARNEELVRRVYGELHRNAPAGLRYATFVLEGGVSFVHVASIDTGGGRNSVTDVAAFRAFRGDAGDRCEEPPRWSAYAKSALTATGRVGRSRETGD